VRLEVWRIPDSLRDAQTLHRLPEAPEERKETVKLTRKQAIRSLIGVATGLFGAMKEAYPQTFNLIQFNSGSHELISLSLGATIPDPPEKPLEACPPSSPTDSFVFTNCLNPDGTKRLNNLVLAKANTFEYGAASTSIDIGAFDHFTFKNGTETVTISRAEMWEALKS